MNDPSGSVAILLATYNGALYLQQQLDSIKKQSFTNWNLYASDDGSIDDTLKILQNFNEFNSNVTILNGPGAGFARNFMSLVGNSSISSNYYAFSDQDDVWFSNKLERAISFLSKTDSSKPALYCSRTTLVDECCKYIGDSPKYKRMPSFGNSIVQNIASGNTMVFNEKAREILCLILDRPLIVHDWTLYQVVTGCGGQVIYDQQSTIFYRQHTNNIIGSGMKPLNRMKNFILAANGRRKYWNDVNINALLFLEDKLTHESLETIEKLKLMRSSSLIRRLNLYFSSGIRHQNIIGDLTNLSYAVLNKI